MSIKRLIPTVGILLSLTYPVQSSAYVIQLKNGGEFRTYHYWNEGNQTMFYIDDGIAGVDKDFVKEIKKSHLTHRRDSKQGVIVGKEREKTARDISPNLAEPSSKEASLEKIKGEESNREKGQVDFEYYRKKNVELRGELEKALERYRSASGNKDAAAQEKARAEFRGVSKQLFDLSDELKAKNNGVLPDWWEKL